VNHISELNKTTLADDWFLDGADWQAGYFLSESDYDN